MRTAYYIPKATNTHSEYVILIAFPQEKWLHERASMLRYTYSTLPVLSNVKFIIMDFMFQNVKSSYFIYLSECRFFRTPNEVYA